MGGSFHDLASQGITSSAEAKCGRGDEHPQPVSSEPDWAWKGQLWEIGAQLPQPGTPGPVLS